MYCESLYISGHTILQICYLALFVGTCTKIYKSLMANTFLFKKNIINWNLVFMAILFHDI